MIAHKLKRMTRVHIIILCLLLFHQSIHYGQRAVRQFIFGHSLINHEYHENPSYETPSQETSMPHWLHYLADTEGLSYAVSGQYGFLPQHRNTPPIAQWGFDVVPFVWDSENESFSDADFTDILITPGNFIQYQGPDVNYYNETFSPISATIDVLDWCMDQEPDMRYYIYENWPDMGGYSESIPPSSSQWLAYNDYLQGDFHDWFVEYHDAIVAQYTTA